ncbi:hypothetical protein [Nostoc sp.]|uniref:hypothetical protein n=1 Tax=Nostoc sp. TaxID=1180 RepID=UPI002FFD4F73
MAEGEDWGDKGAGEAGGAGEEELLMIDLCPMPNQINMKCCKRNIMNKIPIAVKRQSVKHF